jgi:molecular chaperone GrpE
MNEPQSAAQPDPSPATEPAEPAAAEAADTGEPAMESDPLAALAAEAAVWRDRALRAQAELDNFRKRMAREAAETRRFANAALVEDLLPVLDNFDFGLQAARGESESSPITLGMTMVRKQLDDFLAAQGVHEIPAAGQVFDPTRHEAVATEASGEVPEGGIIRVLRKGWLLQDRVLRAPNVIVSSGPADPAAE